jgi:arabinose-5-phosphate isomerase
VSENHIYLEQARDVLKIEGESVLRQAESLGTDFIRAVDLILKCTGRVVVTGMGKSGLVGRKISATLASMGTPSFFLHPGEGVHGDLGMVTPGDVIIALSGSGENDEVIAILPTLKILGTPIISLTGSRNSTLAQNSEIILEIKVEREACPLGLAPTASTTSVLAVGDALAVVLLNARNFKADDYALYHPGGALGRKLLLTVEKLMHTGDKNPTITQDRKIRDAVITMTAHGNHGAAVIVDREGVLAGIITDGDLRKMLEKYDDPLSLPIEQVMTKNPRTITKEKMAAEAMHVMEQKNITVLPVIDSKGVPIGIIHLHDIIKGLTGLRSPV